MSVEKTTPGNIDEKLSTIKYKPDEKSHLSVINQDKCKDCNKACTFFCPARVYEWDESQQTLIINAVSGAIYLPLLTASGISLTEPRI